ncbi:MAG TPA: dienelactone hydrolase family protein [Usitatibacter sp.]|jgi:dienelactone hydrolase|nr:dienelactone hydrolase family protein [Usitatibacter sp.]
MSRNIRRAALFLSFLLAAGAAQAKIVTKTIDYQQGGEKLRGYLAYDDAKKSARPGVLVVHEWWGLNDYVKHRAEELAKMGYVAFAADMYGSAKVTRDPKQAEAWMTAAVQAPGLLAARSKAGLDILRQQPQTDKSHVAAIGFCFGGGAVLQLAYSGEPLDGVVVFHGTLAPPDATQAKQIRTSIVILHGAEDGFTTPETIDAVKKSLDGAKVDWYMVTYANAVHAFSNPEADSYHIPGMGYNAKAATRSWEEMQRFFHDKWGK